jgi:hypothetical protein
MHQSTGATRGVLAARPPRSEVRIKIKLAWLFVFLRLEILPSARANNPPTDDFTPDPSEPPCRLSGTTAPMGPA